MTPVSALPSPPLSPHVAPGDLRAFEEGAREQLAEFGEVADFGLACVALMRAHRVLMQRLNEQLVPHNLTTNQVDVLGALVLSPTGQLSGVELRQRLFLSSATLTHTLDGLEKRELTTRQGDPRNRRIVVVRLTEAGRDAILAVTASVATIKLGLGELDTEQARRLTSLLSLIGDGSLAG